MHYYALLRTTMHYYVLTTHLLCTYYGYTYFVQVQESQMHAADIAGMASRYPPRMTSQVTS